MQQKNKDIQIIGVPFRSGTNRDGAQYAPTWLMKHISMPLRNLLLPLKDFPLTDENTVGIKNYEAVLQMRDELKNQVTEYINKGKKIVTIGGDHSIAIGSVAAVLENYPNVGVIWFDAHTDINTEETSPSGNAHGMPLAALMGLCESLINTTGKKLIPQNVFWIGARDIDAGEIEIIRRLGLEEHVFTAEKVHQIGMYSLMNHIRTILYNNGVEQLHLSFDIDGMDPQVVSATGTPVNGGLSGIDFDMFVEKMAAIMPQLVSVDFVEYNPLLDDVQNSTGKWCVHALEKIMTLFE